MLESRGDLIFFSYADMSTPISGIEKLIKVLGKGFDIAADSRGLHGSDVKVHQSFLREKMGICFNILVRIVVLPGIMDTQCGFKLFRRECAREVFLRCRDSFHSAFIGV